MTCGRCNAWDDERACCRLGKSNPRTKLGSVEVADALGLQALCVHNPHREQLIRQRMVPLLARRYQLPKVKRVLPKISVELIPEW